MECRCGFSDKCLDAWQNYAAGNIAPRIHNTRIACAQESPGGEDRKVMEREGKGERGRKEGRKEEREVGREGRRKRGKKEGKKEGR